MKLSYDQKTGKFIVSELGRIIDYDSDLERIGVRYGFISPIKLKEALLGKKTALFIPIHWNDGHNPSVDKLRVQRNFVPIEECNLDPYEVHPSIKATDIDNCPTEAIIAMNEDNGVLVAVLSK
ncbi:hypothetical protein [Nodularia chucula]|uniref:hypothetical protein n=1 Tax=Nodularia chucula TaxID=3093667 RepID=UPI0039C63160